VSAIAAAVIILLGSFVRRHKLGIVTGLDGTFRLFPGLVRIPNVAFASWHCFPRGKRPKAPIPHLAPALVVEVLSKSNTKGEMNRTLREYFEAGVRLVWIVDPRKKTVRVYTAVDQSVLFSEDISIDGGTDLPGFVLPLNDLVAEDEAREVRLEQVRDGIPHSSRLEPLGRPRGSTKLSARPEFFAEPTRALSSSSKNLATSPRLEAIGG
jgi:Uma2 family endonuclease